MPISPIYKSHFEEERSYHIICKCIPGEKLFRNEENKKYFLQRYDFYLSDFCKTFCYCLLDNHVHFLVQVRNIAEIESLLKYIPWTSLSQTQKHFLKGSVKDINTLIEKQFNSFFVSYVRSFNIRYERVGHLFIRPFRRILIEQDEHFTQLVIYIHANPMKHKLCDDFTKYRWSSYQSIISSRNTKLEREYLLNRFGGKELFIKTHQLQAQYYYAHSLALED